MDGSGCKSGRMFPMQSRKFHPSTICKTNRIHAYFRLFAVEFPAVRLEFRPSVRLSFHFGRPLSVSNFHQWKDRIPATETSLEFRRSDKMADGSQAVGVSGRSPYLCGGIITGNFSRCGGTREPVNPQTCWKKRKKVGTLANPSSNKANSPELFPQTVSEIAGRCRKKGWLLPAFSDFFPHFFRD